MNNDWDALTYDAISTIQESWGLGVINSRRWNGTETIIDAGCGSGRLTKQIVKNVPNGRVYAVDIDSNMINQAKRNLSEFINVDIIQSSLIDIELIGRIDIIFSNAVLHWIPDHHQVFEHFFHLLNPTGELLIQCGGYGNLEKTRLILDKIKDSEKFREYFKGWKNPWYFANPYDTEIILRKVGFRNIHTYFSDDKQTKSFQDRNSYSLFLRTVVMRPYWGYLSNYELRDSFLESFLDEIEQNNSEMKWKLDYVRLNIKATK